MFAGKGGVGKTTCTAATALKLALSGKKILTLSTDPTPSLGHIFEVGKSPDLTQIVNSLYIHEIGINEVKRMWDQRFGSEVYDVFSSFVNIDYNDFTEFITSVLPGMRDEFMVDYIRELSDQKDYDFIVWDTAPLGQTLGLLEMPAMLCKHLKNAPLVYTKLKLGSDSKKPILRILKDWENLSAKDVKFIRDRVGFMVITIPEALAIEQLDEIFAEFKKHEFLVEKLIVNNVLKDMGQETSEFLTNKREQQTTYIGLLHAKYPDMEIVELPMFSGEIKGLESLGKFGKELNT